MSNPMAPTAPNSSVSWVQPAFLSLSLSVRRVQPVFLSLSNFFFFSEGEQVSGDTLSQPKSISNTVTIFHLHSQLENSKTCNISYLTYPIISCQRNIQNLKNLKKIISCQIIFIAYHLNYR